MVKTRRRQKKVFSRRAKRSYLLKYTFLLLLCLPIFGEPANVSAHKNARRSDPKSGSQLQLKEFHLPKEHSDPYGLALGADGSLWFTEFYANRIGKMSINGIFTEYPLADFRRPAGITHGKDGNFWFAEEQGWIGQITPDGKLKEFALPWAGAEPQAITAGPDGNLWFTLAEPSGLGKIGPDGQITLFKLGEEESSPVGITTGSDGNLWFIEQYGKIGFITLRGKITEFARPNMSSTAFGGITNGPDGAIWYTQGNAGSLIGRISPKGSSSSFRLADSSANPVGIITGPGKELWFAELQSNKIGHMNLQGRISEYKLPEKNGGPDYLVNGADGNLWFTSAVNNYIGRIIP